MNPMILTAVAASAMTASALAQCGSCCSGTTEATHTTMQASAVAEKNIVETAVAAGSFNTLAAALEAADLVDALTGSTEYTVFAPTDEAFAKLPKGTVETLLKPENKKLLQSILLYHVVEGETTADDVVKLTNVTTLNGQRADIGTDGGVTIAGANVIATDVQATNGVIHVIDEVILPVTDTIPDVAESAGQFSTLLAAVEAAGLTKTLMGEGPFTVFAPTDDAFAALPGGTVSALLKPENRSKLKEILTYHVVSGRVYANDAVKLDKADTVAGKSINLAFGADGLMVNRSKVVSADIQAANGVIHVIDAVLLP